ncbi:MAG: penicillin-binding transpeptidase domain-containing protein [Rhodothermales bacterium]
MYVVLTLLSLLPLLVVAQIARIYVTQGGELRAQGERQASSFVNIPAIRGAIYDRAGRMLGVNTARYDLALDPTVTGFEQQARSFFERLSKLTGTPASQLQRRVARRSSPKYVQLVRGVTEQQKEEIESWGVPGLMLDPTFARRYNYGPTAAHVLGYVSPEGSGLAGLELHYDQQLTGTDGRRAVKRDRLGRIRAYVDGQVVEPEHGESLILTIDLIRQTILEEELKRGVAEAGARAGSAVALDPRTGAILAMANVPTFDPNRAGTYSAESRRNRAITDRLEPGSTFKLVAAVAAIEQNLIEMEDTVDTGDGWAVLQGRTLHDTHAHGEIPFREVIAVSSNVGTAKVVSDLDAGTFYQYARNLGFGQPTWVDLPGEIAGRLKRPAEWSGTTLTSMGIGYEVDVTPLQLAVAYAALANGGLLVQPYVVSERRDITGNVTWKVTQDSVRRAFRSRTARTILPAFEDAVSAGTATNAQVAGLTIAGKTGTARKVTDGSYEPGAYRASFVGFFPANDPQVVLAVVIDEPQTSSYGGASAAPIFQQTARRWISTFPMIAQQVAPPPMLPEKPRYLVPNVEGLPRRIAARRLAASGLRAAPATNAALTVTAAQEPEGGSLVSPFQHVHLSGPDPSPERGSVIDVGAATTVGERTDSGTTPDFRGWSAREAVYWLARHDVHAQIEGEGLVASQHPSAGRPLTDVVVLRCR